LHLPRVAIPEENRKRWEAKAAGIDQTHGGEATRKRREAIARSNRLNPRQGEAGGEFPDQQMGTRDEEKRHQTRNL
jgi:hypothetical protein